MFGVAIWPCSGCVVASIDRTAYPRFKRLVSARELAESFTPTAEEITWARGRTQTEGHLLSLVVLLKCYQRLGYFPKLRDVPPLLVIFVSRWGWMRASRRGRNRNARFGGIGISCGPG